MLGVPTLTSCGTASFNPLPSDTAGQILYISGGPVTACTLTFGAAFANIPLCVFTPVGSQNPPVFVSAESASAVTINFTSTSSSKVQLYLPRIARWLMTSDQLESWSFTGRPSVEAMAILGALVVCGVGSLLTLALMAIIG